jgi:hypothetical protein
MTAIAQIIGTNKRRSPARHKAVVLVSRTQAGKAGVNKPQFFPSPSHFMNVDISGDMNVAGQIASIMFALGFHSRGCGRNIPQFPNGGCGSNGKSIVGGSQSHWFLKHSKVGVD